jgi:quercetin dioxygenase-like cupin family protein
MKYVRVYADAGGETHFEDVVVAAATRRSPVSDALVEISQPFPVSEAVFRHVVSDHDPDVPHSAPRRQFVVHLAGGAEIEVSDGERRRIGPGDVVLVEDTTGKGHITRRIGDENRVTLFLPLTEPPSEHRSDD